MKTPFILLNRNAYIILLLLTLGVGEMWANTTHPVYCAINPSSLGETGVLYLNVHKGTTSDGGVWFLTPMTKIATTISKAATKETKDLYYAEIEYVEVGLNELQFQIYDAAPPASPRETKVAFSSWKTTSDDWTKPIFDYENGNFTTYPASLAEKTSYVYFDAADWTDAKIQLATGHGLYQGYNELSSHLDNTTIYYAHPTLNWGDAVHIAFVGHKTMFETKDNWLTDMPTWADHYTGYLHYSLSEGKYHFFRRSAGDDNGTAISFSYNETEEALLSTLNKTQTVQARLKTTGSSYSDASFASWPGIVSVERTYMSSATATTSPSAANMTSATIDAVLTSSITLTASANSGYYFEGWGDASDSNPTDGTAAKTYTITDTKTSYAFFSQAYTLTYAPKGDYSTSTVSVYSVDDYSGATTSGSAIPTGHMITLVATPATGYEVEAWYSDASCETAYTNGSGGVTIENGNNTFKLASLNTNSAVYPKFRPKTYTINLANMEATEAGTTSVTLTYNASTNMTSAISKPTKDNYTFDGYWVRNESTLALETQLIDANGNWIKDVAGYTSNDGEGHPTWVHDYAISLYAKWNETPRTITLQVSPTGAGTLSPAGPVTAYIVTPSATITATPNPGWVFKEWQYGTNVGPYAETGTDNTVQVTASVNGTLTAVFEPRYYLVGGEITGEGDGGSGTSSGMPGWDSYTKPFNVITSSPILATCSLTLGTNKNFYIMVRDKTDGLSYGKSGGISLGDDASVKFENQDNKVLFYSNGGTNYTFKITAVDVNGRPTVSVERPHQMHFAHKRVDIDGNDHNDDLGGTLIATINGESAAHEQWFDYGSDVGWTATAETGYSLTWYTDNAYSNAMNPQPGASWSDPDITHDENIFAKFEEKATTVTLSNDGHGKVQINSTDKTSTTCGVTTHRDLTAVPNDGYKFASWTKVSGDDITLSSTSTNPTTLSGLGAGAASGQEVRANFDYRWALKAESVGWGSAEFIIGNISVVGGKTIGYVDISLAANTNYQFTMKDLLTNDIYKNNNTAVQYMTYTNNTDWGFDKTYTYNCGITTAGRGTYRFSWNVTDKTMTVTYQPSYQVNFGASVGGSVTSVVDDDGNSVPNGGYVRSGGSVTYTAAAANEYYTFAGWCTDDTYATKFTDDNPWTNSAISANSNAYAKFISTNFVIYRTGDKDDDPRAALDDVESYEGGTISETIEYRMKVHELDYWYSLCLPFTVSAVRVWDDEDKAYYDLEPYYRTGVGGTLNGGHYIIRTPASATDFPIANFDDWRDPTSATGFLPGKNTPYIIQWHSSYFSGKYISFFGDTGQNIPASMTVGTAPESDDVVNIYGNDAMVRGSVAGAYMLEGDYGGGAWLRQQDPSAYSTVLPFECYIRASSAVTSKYRVIRRDMHTEDTTTGWDDVSNAVTSATITVYTLTGVLVAQFNNCSISEAALRLSSMQRENIYILRTDNECVKLINGLPANQYSEEPIMGGK